MNSVLLLLADLPPWVVFALTGAAFGVLGTLIGHGLAKIGWPLLSRGVVIFAIVVSVQVSRLVMMPSIAQARLNEGLPKQLDDFTVLERASFTSSGLVYEYKLYGNLPADLDVEPIKQNGLANMCANFREDFASKRYSRIDYLYTWASGADSFSLAATDCGQ